MTGLAVALASTTGIANAADTIGFVDPSYVLQTNSVLLGCFGKI